ncbi:MOSC N-terminal beta barrel domain-containing protein [Thozetella sp. PMI_491]|nr:MOSC N-terminal beta barrel domain-containing protein [Thozetella sp. PMI_491]
MGYNARIERFRDHEYPMLRDSIYLDHAGTTPYSKSLIDKFGQDMTTNLFGNPHSASAPSQLSTSRIEDVRFRVLEFFNARPDEFDVVFVANATAGIKLVVEGMRGHAPNGFDYVYHYASHTSLVGVREEARHSLCLDDQQVNQWRLGHCPISNDTPPRPILFGYPGQSNMDGRRLPRVWANDVRSVNAPEASRRVYTLFDAASLAASSPLDLGASDTAPDFTVVSFYKIFGFPDLGALIVRHQAFSVFDSRRYFGGGTVDMVVCMREQWHASKSAFLHARLEDGTLPVHSIVALGAALDVHDQLFGSMCEVAAHVAYLSRRLRRGLQSLRHGNGTQVCKIYAPDLEGVEYYPMGPVVAFNLRSHLGAWVSLAEFEKLAASKNLHVRTGGVCNPGGIASALSLQPWELKENFSSGFRCGTENDIVAGKPTGVIRASLGAMSTISDVDQFVAIIGEFYRDAAIPQVDASPSPPPEAPADLSVESIWIYPIKSCGGFEVPRAVDWEVRPEGLAWDREWCLVHRGSGQALSQKRHPRMCLIRPYIDLEHGKLRVVFADPQSGHLPKEISIPLSSNPALFRRQSVSSRVCGEEIYAQTYSSVEVNGFFSNILGVQCMLARFPPGGQGKSMRHSKAHLQQHQTIAQRVASIRIPGLLPAPRASPSPPDSDAEGTARRILLSNESPILAINLASLDELNRHIGERGGRPVSPAVFRANVVISSSKPVYAYAEDSWRTLRIGQQQFSMLGSCRRCNMVCINQDTADKSEEPFVSLAKTRRFNGRVYFGNHMGHCPSVEVATREAQYPTIRVGDPVQADTG